MGNYDYEIRDYCVEWKIRGKLHKKAGFSTEESAAEFARKKLKKADEVTLIKESYAIGWWNEFMGKNNIKNVIQK